MARLRRPGRAIGFPLTGAKRTCCEDDRRAARSEPGRALDRRQRYLQSVARFWDRPHLPVRAIAGLDRYGDLAEEMPGKALGLHVREVETDAHVRAATEWNEGKPVPFSGRFIGKAHRVEA